MQAGEKPGAEFGGALDHFLFNENAEGGAGNGAAERIAAEGAAVVAGLEDAENFARGENGGDRIEASGEGFADDENVGLDAFVHVGEELAGAAEAGLNFVSHEQDAILAAEFGGLAEESVGRNLDAGLALDGLNEEGAGVGRDGVAQGVDVAIGNDLEAGGEGAEAVAILII